MTQHIGVAMSGGGHRASAWALGTMFYLVHAGKHAELAAISSVSGGSITNGLLAHEFPDLRSADDAEFAGKVQHLVRNVADVGLFFWGPRTNRYVLVTLALAIVTGAGLLTTIVWTAITGLRLGAFICLIVTAVLAVIATALFERRSVTADRALAAEHFSTTTSRRSGPGGERVGAAGLAPGQARVAGRGTRGQRPPCGQGRHVPARPAGVASLGGRPDRGARGIVGRAGDVDVPTCPRGPSRPTLTSGPFFVAGTARVGRSPRGHAQRRHARRSLASGVLTCCGLSVRDDTAGGAPPYAWRCACSTGLCAPCARTSVRQAGRITSERSGGRVVHVSLRCGCAP